MRSHKILKIASGNKPLQYKLSKQLGISVVLAQVLINRGINTAQQADKFLNTALTSLFDPYLFSDMHKAVKIIRDAVRLRKKALIFGDYDVDGITSLALLKETLKKMGLEIMHYLPHRVREGYGLTKDISKIAKTNNIKLLITVDCGTNNRKEIAQLRKQGIEVIVTDHHENADTALPDASAIINPKLKNSNYKYRELAGVGVAFKLSQALSGSNLFEELDLVSLGTIADVAPLTGENRIIVKEGLVRLSKTKRPGLNSLIESARINRQKFNATSVSFMLAPRLNASGRMDSAETSLNLLMSATDEEAVRLTKIIEAHNRERQKTEIKILEEAEDLINRDVDFKEHKIIVLAKEGWHHGVLGIVAAKLADRFYRPAIVISKGKNLCKGSGRSIKSFHLFQALLECKKFLSSFGGHAHAAGLVITNDNIERFTHNINRLAKEKLSLEDLLPGIDIDMELDLSEINMRVISEMDRLEPFGASNPEPLFYTRNLKMKGEPQVLGRETLKFWVTDGSTTHQAIGFGMSSFKASLEAADYLDLVYRPRLDSWRDDTSLILEAKDIFFH